MGRKRKINKSFPERVYFKHGAYYFVDANNKWVRLDSKFSVAMAVYGEMLRPLEETITMERLVIRYLTKVAPKKADATYKNDLQRAKVLIKVFGRMRPEKIDCTHVAKYLDSKGNVGANRDIV